MTEQKRQEFIKKELQAIYDEFNANISQLIILKPFLKDLISVVDGAEPRYDLDEIIQKIK